MHPDNPAENNEKLRESLRALFLTEVGVFFEIQGLLYIREVSDGFAVGEEIEVELSKLKQRKRWEKVFSKFEDALDCFIGHRVKHRIGDDYNSKD